MPGDPTVHHAYDNIGYAEVSNILHVILPDAENFCRKSGMQEQNQIVLTIIIRANLFQSIHVQPAFMGNILQCTEQGLGSFGIDIQSVCLEIVNLLASNVYYDQNSESFLYISLMPFVKRIFDMILAREIDHNNRTECCRATFTLLCVYRTRCDQILEMLLQQFAAESERREQLQREFNELARPDNLYNNRNSHLQFSTRFERFMVNMVSST